MHDLTIFNSTMLSFFVIEKDRQALLLLFLNPIFNQCISVCPRRYLDDDRLSNQTMRGKPVLGLRVDSDGDRDRYSQQQAQ